MCLCVLFVCICLFSSHRDIVSYGIWKALERSTSIVNNLFFFSASSFNSWLYKTQTSDASVGVSKLSDCVHWSILTADCWIRVSIILISKSSQSGPNSNSSSIVIIVVVETSSSHRSIYSRKNGSTLGMFCFCLSLSVCRTILRK